MPTIDPEMVRAKEEVEAEILQRPGVTAIDVGLKEVGGRLTDTVAIRVHVRKKGPVPDEQRIPTTIGGFPTDVLEREYRPATAPCSDVNADTTLYNPLQGGISGGDDATFEGSTYVGTLGTGVTDGTNYWMVTNAHVLMPDGYAQFYPVVQPALNDGGTSENTIGTVNYVELSGSAGLNVDVGLVLLNGSRAMRSAIVDIGPVAGAANAQLGQTVRKRGRSSRLTYGIVDGLYALIPIQYPPPVAPPDGWITFNNQISIHPAIQNGCFGTGGDSGSVVVDPSNNVVGLFFAANDIGGGFANPIASVLNALTMICGRQISIWTGNPGEMAQGEGE